MLVKNVLLKVKMFYLLPILYLLALLISLPPYHAIDQLILSAPISLTSLFISGIVPFSVKLIDTFSFLDPVSVPTVIACVIINFVAGLSIDIIFKSNVKKMQAFLVYMLSYVVALFIYPRAVTGGELYSFLIDYQRFPGYGEWNFCAEYITRRTKLVHKHVPLYYEGRFPTPDGLYNVDYWKYCLDQSVWEMPPEYTYAPLFYKNKLVVARMGDICSNPIGEFINTGYNNWESEGVDFKYFESGKPTERFKQELNKLNGYYQRFITGLKDSCRCYSSDAWLFNIKMNKDWEWNLDSYRQDFKDTWVYLNRCCLHKQAVYWMNEYAKHTKSRYLKKVYVESRGDSVVLVRIPWIGFQRIDKLPGVVQLKDIPGYGQVNNIRDFIKDSTEQ